METWTSAEGQGGPLEWISLDVGRSQRYKGTCVLWGCGFSLLPRSTVDRGFRATMKVSRKPFFFVIAGLRLFLYSGRGFSDPGNRCGKPGEGQYGQGRETNVATYKVTWIFKDAIQLAGFSESWYVVASSKQIAHANALQVLPKRLQSISSGVIAVAQRTTGNVPPYTPDVLRQRDVIIDFLGWPGSAGQSFGGEGLVFAAAKVRFSNNTIEAFSMRELRGLPNDAWQNNSDKVANTLTTQMLLSAVPLMQSLGFCFRHVQRGTPPTIAFIPVQQGQYESMTRRATGRPSYLPRGRRFAKRTSK